MNKVYFCADMDAFFASVEQSDNPGYRGKPVIVAGRAGRRGVVSSCSYEARKYGVHSAMPALSAKKLCPEGIFVPARMDRYREVSEKIMAILKNYSSSVMQNSVDEAFLDMTGTEKLFGPPADAAKKIKRDIMKTTGLTVSVGIAENMYLAKLASDFKKPDGIYEVERGKGTEFIDSVKFSKLWGIGKSTLTKLSDSGIKSAAQLRNYPEKALASIFGEAAASFLYKICRGEDPGIFVFEHKSRSISNEITFERDISDYETAKEILLDLSHKIMFRLMKKNFSSKTLFLKIRLGDFSSSTIQTTKQAPFTSSEEVFETAVKLLETKWDTSKKIRLIGLGFQNVYPQGEEIPELFETMHEKQNRVEKAVLGINSKFGGDRVIKAALLKRSRDRQLPNDP